MAKKESEIVVICKIGDFSGLKEAESSIQQEQLERFIQDVGTIRVRKSVSEEGTVFEAGLKPMSKPGTAVKSTSEQEDPVSAGYFEQFRLFADSLKVKTRYIFPGASSAITVGDKEYTLPPVKYEVDVYHRFDGRESEWCKIDVDVSEMLETLNNVAGVNSLEEIEYQLKVTHLPFKPQMAFFAGDCTDEQKKAMAELWANEWSQTPFGQSKVEPEASTTDLPPDSQQPEVTEPTEADNERTQNESV